MKRFCDLKSGDKVYKIDGIKFREVTLASEFTLNHGYANPDYGARVHSGWYNDYVWVNKSAYKKSEAGKSYEIFADLGLAKKHLIEKAEFLKARYESEIDEELNKVSSIRRKIYEMEDLIKSLTL